DQCQLVLCDPRRGTRRDRPPHPGPPPSFPPRISRIEGQIVAVRPSTAPPDQVRGRAQDEVITLRLSTTSPHPEQRDGLAGARVEGRLGYVGRSCRGQIGVDARAGDL